MRDYGSLCQAITELAVELDAKLSAEDCQTLNRCLDKAIAEAVTEYAGRWGMVRQDRWEQMHRLAE